MTGTLLVRAMLDDDVSIWGDGSTFKGNDIERFYRYGLLANPNLRIYKPWLDRKFVAELGGRHGDVGVAGAARPALPRLRREGLLDRRQHLGRDARGQAPRAARHLHGDRLPDHGRARSGTRRSRSRPRTSPSSSRTGGRSRINGRDFPTAVDLVREANAVGGRHGLGMSDQIENRIIEAKSRGIYEAPGMALLHIAYERLLNAIHNEDTVAKYHGEGRRLGRLLYEGRWFDPQALMLRESLHRWIGVAGHRQRHPAAAPRPGLLGARHARPALSYHPEKLSMERSEDPAFSPDDRIGQLTMRNLDIADSRSKLERYAAHDQLAPVRALIGELPRPAPPRSPPPTAQRPATTRSTGRDGVGHGLTRRDRATRSPGGCWPTPRWRPPTSSPPRSSPPAHHGRPSVAKRGCPPCPVGAAPSRRATQDRSIDDVRDAAASPKNGVVVVEKVEPFRTPRPRQPRLVPARPHRRRRRRHRVRRPGRPPADGRRVVRAGRRSAVRGVGGDAERQAHRVLQDDEAVAETARRAELLEPDGVPVGVADQVQVHARRPLDGSGRAGRARRPAV